MAKVSILMPACNVEKFLRECMDSVVNQTLKDIEIICIDDGSKDSTGSILDEYAEKDDRIKVVHKVNTGYGHSMNTGLDLAAGEYIGIIETDDFAEPDMFEKLYDAAKKNDADVVKSNYFTYTSSPEPKSEYLEVLKQYNLYDKVFCPTDRENQDIFRVRPCIWTGLYRRQMLIDNKIRFNETPGASYQDTSFAFKIWTSAKRACLVRDAYLHYRIDNANSSVKSSSKVFCLCDEYKSSEEFLNNNPEKKALVEKLLQALKYESYRWNLNRLSQEYKYAFLIEMNKQFSEANEKGLLEKEYFNDNAWNNLTAILNNVNAYYNKRCRKDIQISVIMPVYNGERTLKQSVEVACNQTLKNIEIICVNDGSEDGSLALLEELAQEDPRIVVMSQTNKGSGSARNKALRQASGEYISFLDADDLYPKDDTLECLYNKAKENSVNICGGSMSVLKPDGKLITNFSGSVYGQTFHDSGVSKYKDYQFEYGYQRFIYKRTMLIQNKIFFPDYLRFQDPPFMVKAMICSKEFYHIPEPTYLYREEHKTVNWTPQKVCHLLQGLTDLLDISSKYKYRQLHNRVLYRLNNDYYKVIFEKINNSSVRAIVNKLNTHIDKNLVDAEKSSVLKIILDAKATDLLEDATKAGNKKKTAVKKDTPKVTKEQMEIRRLKKEIKSLRASKSYKIGRFITFIPRKIRGGFRCCKAHGVGYTLRYAVGKVRK